MNKKMEEIAEIEMYKKYDTVIELPPKFDMFMDGWKACFEYLKSKSV